MSEFGSIHFTDGDSGDRAWAGVRVANGLVGVTLSLSSGSDTDVYLGREDAKTLSSAILTAARFVEVQGQPLDDPRRVAQIHAGVRCCDALRTTLIEGRHLLGYDPELRTVFLAAPTDGAASLILAHCPFCGVRLARPLRDVYFEVLEERGLYPHDWSIRTEDHLAVTDGGAPYLDDTWWRELEDADPAIFDITLPTPGDILQVPITGGSHRVLVLGVHRHEPYRDETILLVPAVDTEFGWSTTAVDVVAWAYSRGRWPAVGADLDAAGALLAETPRWQHSYFNPVAGETQRYPETPTGWTYAPAGEPGLHPALEPIDRDTLSAGELVARIDALRNADG